MFFQFFWVLLPGFVSWVLGFVSCVLGFVCWVLGLVFWVSGLVFWVLGFVFWVLGFVFWVQWPVSPIFCDLASGVSAVNKSAASAASPEGIWKP